METIDRMGVVHHYYDLFDLFSDDKVDQEWAHLGTWDMEMVLNGDGDLLWPPGFGVVDDFRRLLNRPQLHAQRKGFVFRLWT